MSTSTEPRREQYIPIRCAELVDVLCNTRDPATQKPLSPEDQVQVRRFARILMALYHHQYHQRLNELKSAYAPFDPDAETKPMRTFPDAERAQRQDALFQEFIHLLERANYTRMTRQDIEQAMQGASLWGLELDVDWNVFERFEMFYRGDQPVKRSFWSYFKFWKTEEVKVASFRRLVLILKQKKHWRLGTDADVENIYLKLFKDMPKVDLEMVIPGSRVKLSKLDKGMIFYPLASGLGIVFYKILVEVFGSPDFLGLSSAVALSWGLIVFLGGYGYRSYNSYSIKKQAYTLQLTQSLYYQNLDNNAGVLYRLLDEAEEQENREALLAYFYLWRYAPAHGWNAQELDQYIEMELEKILNREIDFEVDDALAKLEKLGILVQEEGRYRVVPIEEATAKLDAMWDRIFNSEGGTVEELLPARV